MSQKMTINGDALAASQEDTLEIEQFLHDNYLFRRNVLNGKVEFATLNTEEPQYRTLTQEALNSIVIRAKREDICEKGNPRTEIMELIHSEEVPVHNPIREYLDGLPKWDGQNHVAQLFSRLPGISSEQHGFLAIWLRSSVAHWLQMDTIHGNECVPTLIGAQGCGKTTFVTRLLPPHLRQYFLDHLNLSNKFDKEMALTNNLLVNLDELEAIRPCQHAALKQTLSKSKVNGRPIFGCSQEDKPRYASFVATTNNPHPLSDATGSRRYICLTIPKGQLIDNTGDIDYEQLYAQVLYEVRELKVPYWYNHAEVARIQELNINYMEQKDIAEIISVCFRKPKEGEKAKSLNNAQILKLIQTEYPSVKNDHSTKIHIGFALKELGIEHTIHGNVPQYKLIPLKSA
jgi:Predicted P-loop ATPase and inactivated derivatives